jgi:cobalt-zinc-cadmium efflux system membrane fusion protein
MMGVIHMDLRAAAGVLAGLFYVGLSGCGTETVDGEHAHGHEERPRMGLTAWAGVHEFFVDYAVPAADEEVQFAVHVARLNPHLPEDSTALSALKVELLGAEGTRTAVEGAPVQDGIWMGSWKAPRAGAWRLFVTWQGQEVDCGMVQVEASAEAAFHVAVPEAEIALSKEAAWSMPFALGVAGGDTVFAGLKLAGTWREAPQREVSLVAPISGTVQWAEVQLIPGMEVDKGSTLFRMRPQASDAAGVYAQWTQASEEYAAADAAFRRIEGLAQQGTATAQERDEARLRRNLAQQALARLEPYRPNDRGVAVNAPSAGRVKALLVPSGAWVAAGSALASLSRGTAGMLEVAVPAATLSGLKSGAGARVQDGKGGWHEARLISVGVEARQGLVPTFWEVDGWTGAIGTFSEVQLKLEAEAVPCAVPTTALLEQYGTFQVVVAEGGEQYAMRTVEVGRKSAGKAEILRGIDAGERIVTQGGYAVRMVSMAGSTPAHGHSH